MVYKEIINKTFIEVIKCSVKSRINKLSIMERFTLLDDKLNNREKKDYFELMLLSNEYNEILEDTTTNDSKRMRTQKLLDIVNDRLYYYDQRIFNGYEKHSVMDMGDVFPDGSRKEDYTEDIFNSVGRMVYEVEQTRSQFDYFWTHEGLTPKEYADVNLYLDDGYEYINGSIYNTNFWKNLNPSEKDEWRSRMPVILKNLDNAINKTDGLDRPMTLFHGGYWDISLEPGEHFTLDGYTSFSFRENVARSFMMGKHYQSDRSDWLMVAYTPSGVKGLCVEYDDDFKNVPNEHEYLTGRGQGGTVWSYDEDRNIVYVLLDK